MDYSTRSAAARHYSPLYFLASLGAGGLVVTFFMYPMFWVPHPSQPVPVFEDVLTYALAAGPVGQAMVGLAVIGIVGFAVLHYALLIWNLRHYAVFRRSEAYAALLSTNAETQLKAVPLTLAMSVNVGFILGLVFVPRLWSAVEYLFPLAILVYAAIGVFAFALLARFFGRVLTQGGFDSSANNSFAQLLPAFALAMVAVGLSAPSAMSATPWIVGVSLALSTFFIAAALLITVIAVGLAVIAMVQHGTAPEAAPTIMVVVPILTVLAIALLRQDHGLHTTLAVHGTAGDTFMFLTRMLSIQVLFALLGLLVLRRQGYAARYLSEAGTRSAGSYALVCPGVALSVMGQFWVNKGLVAAGLVAKFGLAYWVLTMPALVLQVAMILLVWRLHRLHFSKSTPDAAMVAAE